TRNRETRSPAHRGTPGYTSSGPCPGHPRPPEHTGATAAAHPTPPHYTLEHHNRVGVSPPGYTRAHRLSSPPRHTLVYRCRTTWLGACSRCSLTWRRSWRVSAIASGC